LTPCISSYRIYVHVQEDWNNVDGAGAVVDTNGKATYSCSRNVSLLLQRILARIRAQTAFLYHSEAHYYFALCVLL
jgi:hypothetical protein